ncbi:hypothetical protein J1C56_08945 [Aminobacter anthyllidis]|uniref:Uncharacterized protein n=1 Tax=Aminobacter anthyllidis TaxID=1035067 RepID=A0A9X1D425_9HYPH|nr:hypothetical protein [Aminobacter anthyllidis]MBT1155717.1 hypothetical protein [Aminobacter anthyllidis]
MTNRIDFADELEDAANRNLLRIMIRKWLEHGGYLPVPMLDEDDEVDGNA